MSKIVLLGATSFDRFFAASLAKAPNEFVVADFDARVRAIESACLLKLASSQAESVPNFLKREGKQKAQWKQESQHRFRG